MIFEKRKRGTVRRSPQKSEIIDPKVLLNAYCYGFFPMADSNTGEIRWYSPNPRGIMDLNEFKISRSLRQSVKKGIFEVRVNTDFEGVMRGCASRKETWISDSIIKSYLNLYSMGFAHCVESWREGHLAGGLYGVAIRGAFFGESMFSREQNASKVALVSLVRRLQERGFELLDTQFLTPHLERLGAKAISREEYMQRLERALGKDCSFL